MQPLRDPTPLAAELSAAEAVAALGGSPGESFDCGWAYFPTIGLAGAFITWLGLTGCGTCQLYDPLPHFKFNPYSDPRLAMWAVRYRQ